MAEIVNLRRARKDKARRDAEVAAAANRASHGRTPAERKRDEAEARRLAKIVDGARLSSADDPG